MRKISLIMTITLIFGLFAGNCFSMETEGVDIHGFISQGYMDTTDNNFFGNTKDGSFEFSEFGINFSKEMNDKLRVGMQIFSKDFGNYGNGEVTIDWAYGDYRWKDWMGFRAGKLKAPFGLYNESRDVDMLRTWIFLPQSVYPEVTREVTLNLMGGGIYGNIDLEKFGSLSYQALAGTQNIAPNESLAQNLMGITHGGSEVSNQSIDVSKKYVFSLEWATPLDGLRVGGTYSKADMLIVSNYDFTGTPVAFLGAGTWYMDFEPENYVLSAEYTWNDLLIAGEYWWADRAIARDDGRNSVEKPDGWYLGGAYRFTDWFELGSYYSEYDADRDARDDDPRGYLKDIALTTRFDLNAFWTIKLEGHMFDGTGTVSGFDNPDPFVDDWKMFAVKTTFSF